MAAAPFVYLRPSDDGTVQGALLRAAFDGNLGRLKETKPTKPSTQQSKAAHSGGH